MAFNTKIDFYDEDENRFSLPICGASDNSMLTLAPFFDSHYPEHFNLYAKEGHAVQLLPNAQIAMLNEAKDEQKLTVPKRRRRGKRGSSETEPPPERKRSVDIVPSGSSVLDKLPPITESEVKFLLQWLNASWTKTQILKLPRR